MSTAICRLSCATPRRAATGRRVLVPLRRPHATNSVPALLPRNRGQAGALPAFQQRGSQFAGDGELHEQPRERASVSDGASSVMAISALYSSNNSRLGLSASTRSRTPKGRAMDFGKRIQPGSRPQTVEIIRLAAYDSRGELGPARSPNSGQANGRREPAGVRSTSRLTAGRSPRSLPLGIFHVAARRDAQREELVG